MIRVFMLLGLVSLASVACSPDIGDLDAYFAEVKARKFGPIEPLPEPKEPTLTPRVLGADPFAPRR